MKLTETEIEAAKRALAKMRERQTIQHRIDDPSLSKEDRELMKKYPRHTLEDARYINASECGDMKHPKGSQDAFWNIRRQETR